jgi:uncharacterized protein (DUF58 family)
MAPTVRLAALTAGIGALGLILPLSVVSALWVLVFIGALLDARTVRTAPQASRPLDALSRGVASPFRIELEPSPSLRRASRIVIRQPQPPDIVIDPPQTEGPALVGTITARRRGIHTLPPAAVMLTGPLGLASVVHQLDIQTTVSVHPDLVAAHKLSLSARRGLLQTEGRNRGPLGIGTDFDSVREYRPDDDVRQINWLATARTGRAMSTVYRQENERDMVIVVDTGRLTAGSFAPTTNPSLTRLDALFDAVAALAFVADEVGDRVGLLAFDNEERVRLTPSRRGGQRIVHAALGLEPRPVQSDFSLALLRLPTLRRSTVIIATELLDGANNADLCRIMPTLNHAHDVIVVSANDPSITRSPRTDDAWMQSSGALLTDVNNVADRLRSGGATVVLAEPQMLAAEAARAYLSRRSGRQPNRQTANQ